MTPAEAHRKASPWWQYAAATAVLAALLLPLSARAWQARGEAPRVSPDRIRDTYDQACSFYALAQYKKARERFLQASELTTDRMFSLRCKMKAADCLFHDERQPPEERYEKARAAYEQLLGDYPGEPALARAQFQVGRSFEEMKLHEEATAAYEAVIARYPRQPLAATALYRIGMCLLSRGDCEDARNTLERLLKDYPKSPEAGQAAFDIARSYALEVEMQEDAPSEKKPPEKPK